MNKPKVVAESTMYKFHIIDQEKDNLVEQFKTRLLEMPPIPKTIHQVWIGPSKPPYHWINSFKENFLQKYPGWKYKLWTEKDIQELTLINRDIYDKEENISGKVDILRYELLYQFGGVYIDSDILWLDNKPLDPLLENTNLTRMFVGREDHRMMGICVIGSAIHNPILKYTIDLLKSTYPETRLQNKWEPWISSGPVFFTEAVKDFDITIYPIHYFYPLNWHYDQRKANIKDYPDSYMIHYGYSTNNLSSDE